MGFYDVDVNELTVSVVARATGISEPNNMQVRTWFRDYANGFIEQIEDDDILNMASDRPIYSMVKVTVPSCS